MLYFVGMTHNQGMEGAREVPIKLCTILATSLKSARWGWRRDMGARLTAMVEYQPELLLLFEAFVRNVARTRESPGLSLVSSDSEDGCMRKWRRRSNDRGSSFGWSGLRLSVQVGGASASSGGPFPDSGVPWSTRFVSRTLGAFGSTSPALHSTSSAGSGLQGFTGRCPWSRLSPVAPVRTLLDFLVSTRM
jgi:hypothetical protein